MDDIRELKSILDEEDRNVISNNIPVSLIGVELDSESPHISHGISASSRTQDCRESNEDWSGARRVGQNLS